MKRKLHMLLLISALFGLAGGLFGPIYAVFVEEIGGNLLDAGGAYSAFAISAGLLMYLFGKWEDHFKKQEKLIILGYAFSCLGFLGYLFIRNPLDLFLVQILFGISESITFPAYDGLYSKHLDKGRFASEWGVSESLDFIMMGIAALAGGFLATLYGFRLLFTVMFGLSLIGLFFCVILTRR